MNTDLLIILAVSYFIGLLGFVPGIFRAISRPKRTIDQQALPYITVLVCARNEEKSISRCLLSLSELDYPSEKTELLIVNDQSTDKTPHILAVWKLRLPNLRVIETRETDSLHGKVNALTHGFEAAKGEIILMTDADCVVPRGWAQEIVSLYDDRTGMVASITSINGGTVFDSCHSLEIVQVLAMGMSGINYSIPTSIIGNNFSIRKSVYTLIGGYQNVAFSVTEDLALFQAVWQSGWKVRSKVNIDLSVVTDPTPDYKTWWRQKQRWVRGGKSIGLPGFIIIGIGYIGTALLLLLPFASSIPLAIGMFTLKCVSDLMILLPTMSALGKLRLLWYLPLYQIYLLYFLLCVPILYFQRDVIWKERVYHS
jgi:cellulose synthase/poly-beta-1,6-N-acetylglucosamine synthase-like glycosyltransferase